MANKIQPVLTPNQTLKSSLNKVINMSNSKQMKKADVLGTIKIAEDELKKWKQKVRTFEGSLHNESIGKINQQSAALKKQVKESEKKVKSLSKYK